MRYLASKRWWLVFMLMLMPICVRHKIIRFIPYVPEKLFPDWLKEVKKNRSLIKGREKNLRITTPYVVTHTCVVELIFKMCKELKQPADTRYRTVELFDRYVSTLSSLDLQFFLLREILSKCDHRIFKFWSIKLYLNIVFELGLPANLILRSIWLFRVELNRVIILVEHRLIHQLWWYLLCSSLFWIFSSSSPFITVFDVGFRDTR